MELPPEIAVRHEVAVVHQRRDLDIAEPIEIGADASETRARDRRVERRRRRRRRIRRQPDRR